jgi:hypothetical protein
MPTFPLFDDPWLLYEFTARLQMDLEDDWRLLSLQAAEFYVSTEPLIGRPAGARHYSLDRLPELQSAGMLNTGEPVLVVMARGHTEPQIRSGTFVVP